MADKIQEDFKNKLLKNKGLDKYKKPIEVKEEIDHFAGTKGYAADIKRDLLSKGLFDDMGDFKVKEFEKQLKSGNV
jgi:hypothetical protein